MKAGILTAIVILVSGCAQSNPVALDIPVRKDPPPPELPFRDQSPIVEKLTELTPHTLDEESIRYMQRVAKEVWAAASLQKLPKMHGNPVATIEIELAQFGDLAHAGLIRSSGSRIWDAAALRAVKMASPFPPPPPDLKAFSLNLAAPGAVSNPGP